MKILKYSIISDINKGDVFISNAINFIDKETVQNIFTNEDILFKKFDLSERLLNSKKNSSVFYNLKRKGRVMSFLTLMIKQLIFNIKDKKTIENQVKLHDCIFIGGGNLLMEKNGGDLFYRVLKISEIAKKFNKKVIIYGVGLGPFQFSYKKRLIKLINMVDRFSVRDIRSKEICENTKAYFNKKIGISLDPAFVIPDMLEKFNSKTKYIGFNFMNYSNIVYNSQFNIDIVVSNICDIHKSHRLPIKIINTSFGEDLSISTLIKRKLEELNIECVIYNIQEIEDLPLAFSDLKFFIASRMHSSIFSMSFGVPTLIYSWHPKIYNLQKMLFSENFKNTLLLSENFDSKEILEKIDNYNSVINLNEVTEKNKVDIYYDYKELFRSI